MAAEVFFVLCVLVTAGLVSGHVYHMPAVRMEATDSSTCHTDIQLDAVRTQLSKKVSAQVLNVACGGPGWKRVAFLNMSDSNQTCPEQWRLYEEDSVRVCGRPVGGASCDSVHYSVDNYAYIRVCGRVTGYQYASPGASNHFLYNPTPGNAINENYLDGVSITHGFPRQHIWSFYGGVFTETCCNPTHLSNMESLGFIGNNSFCDTGNPKNLPVNGALFTYHPLWEGDTRCVSSPTCCSPSSGPWFYATLNVPSIQDIEVRICADQDTGDEDTPVGLIEIYIR